MTLNELTKALRANEIEILPAHLAAFSKTEAGILRDFAATYRDASSRSVVPTWAQDAKLDKSALLSIAENYDWAADEIERLAKEAA